MKLVLLALLAFLAIPFVSAQYSGNFFYGTQQVIDSIVFNLEPFFRALLGGYDWSGYLLFEKVLLFILFSIIVGLVLSNIPVFSGLRNKKILRLIAVIISLLAVRNLNYIWVGTILVQYQVLFVTVAGILPFMIYWAFLKGVEDDWVRKVAWVFYAVIYFGLWMTTELVTYAWVYVWGAIIALIYGIFIDPTVHRWIAVRDAKKGQTARRDTLVGVLRKEIEEIRHMQANNHMTKPAADRAIKAKQDAINSLMK